MDAGTSRRSTGPPVIPARGDASHSLGTGGRGGARCGFYGIVAPSGEEKLLGLLNYISNKPQTVYLTPCLQPPAKILGSG